ncbi:MAG: type IV pilus biogenesis/stability protein PilW [Neisseriaceae bacterium]|nr:MAG: type IV pilus biogenesis/stability protein PilW [Neisseriaceae bacterium]
MKRLKLFVLIGLFCIMVGCVTNTAIDPEEKKRNFAALKTQLAVEFVNVKDYRNAVSVINEAIDIYPSYDYAWMVKGIVYQYMKDYSTARSAYLKALSINSANAEINNNYGWFICNELNDPSQSLTYFDKALMDLTYPTPELAYMNKGICLAKVGQYSQAEDYLNKSITSNPGFPYSTFELSRLKYKQGNYLRAKQYFDVYKNSVSVLRPQDLELGYNIASHLGNIHEQNKYLDELRIRYPYSEETLRLSR